MNEYRAEIGSIIVFVKTTDMRSAVLIALAKYLNGGPPYIGENIHHHKMKVFKLENAEDESKNKKGIKR